jgi:F0F1-type ATP synthase membrane subunit b/b'
MRIVHRKVIAIKIKSLFFIQNLVEFYKNIHREGTMFKRNYVISFFALVLCLSIAILYGCAKPPTMEVENAEKALADAKQKEADLYVQDVFTKAQDALKNAKDLIAMKKYTEAKKAAEDAATLAQQAISMVEPNKEKMKTEVEQMIPEVQGTMDELKSLVAKAIKKKASINREEIQSSIGKWEVDMATVKDQLQGGNIRQANDQLIAIKEQMKMQRELLVAAAGQEPAAKK